MRYHLLYVTTPSQIEQIKNALQRFDAQPLKHYTTAVYAFELRHRLLEQVILEISLIQDIDAISAHLRQFPVDLLIYDERGPEALDAPVAVERIKKDVRLIADLWGPDFLFPLSRVVVILEKENNQAERAFELGRLHVREVCVAPNSVATLLLWLKRVLTKGIVRRKRSGLALSGGGLEGFLYQLGVLYALSRALSGEGRTFADIDVVSGVSSGAIAGTMFAAKIPLEECIRATHKSSTILPPLSVQTIFDFAAVDITKRILRHSLSFEGLSPQKWLNKALRSFPTGIIKGQKLEDFFRKTLEKMGIEDAFASFDCELYVGATDQDSYEHVIFGKSPWDKIPVSEAVRASCALPPLFMPKFINGRWFMDGQVTKTTDLELVIERGCSLVIIVNPLKPHPTHIPGDTDKQGGIYATIQTIKALVSTRFEASLGHVTERYPDIDFIVFEPDEECAHIMSGSPMRYKIRTQIIELAFKDTLRKLRERHHVYSVKLAKYGFRLHNIEQLKSIEETTNNFEQLV